MLEFVKNKFKDFFTIISIFYFLGFIITKTYLLRYKIHNLELLQAKYVSVGAFFLINIIIVCLPFLLEIYFPHLFKQQINEQHNRIIIVSRFFIMVLVGISLSHTLIYRSYEKNWTLDISLQFQGLFRSLSIFYSLFTWYYLMVLCVAITLYVVLSKSVGVVSFRQRLFLEIPIIEYILIGCLTVFGLTVIKSYSIYIYPNITPALGGGSVKQAQIIISKSQLKLSPDILPIDDNKSNEKDIISAKIFLLEETNNNYFFLVCENMNLCKKKEDLIQLDKNKFHTIQIKKELIKGIIY